MQPSTVGARAPAGGAPPEQQNWLQEWAGRTPLACRALIYAALPCSLVSFLAGLSPVLDVVPTRVVLAGEVWRLFTSVLAQDGLLTLVIVLVMLGVVLPPMELRRGTLPFALRLLTSALLVNVAFCLLGTALAAIPWRALQGFGSKPGLGLWPVLLMLIAEDKLLDPTGETAFLCFKVNNRQYPWVLALVFSLFSFFPLLDLFLGVALGHARALGAAPGRRAAARPADAPPHSTSPRARAPHPTRPSAPQTTTTSPPSSRPLRAASRPGRLRPPAGPCAWGSRAPWATCPPPALRCRALAAMPRRGRP